MQILKTAVKRRIEDAALGMFAKNGFCDASVAKIAESAGTATGNVYRYFRNKQELLVSLIPKSFASECLEIVEAKIAASHGKTAAALVSDEGFRRGNADLLEFLMTNRLKILILLKGCPGTVHSEFSESMKSRVVNAAGSYFVSIGKRGGPALILLEALYENLMHATIRILEADIPDKTCRNALLGLMTYHLSGLAGLT